MKKITILLLMFTSILVLSACQKEEELIIEPESLITMDNLDLYMFRDDVQYVDLRNFDNIMKYGYIDGFEKLPFFDFLDNRAFDRDRTYEFDADQIVDEDILFRLFKKDKAIFLYADGCIRSGYVKDALNYLGYERVYVLGGYYEYKGNHVITGNGTFDLGNTFYRKYTDTQTSISYIMYGDYDVANNISSLRIDVLDADNISIRYSDDYDSILTIIESHIDIEIYNFNEVVEGIENSESDIYLLDTVNWDDLNGLYELFKLEYTD